MTATPLDCRRATVKEKKVTPHNGMKAGAAKSRTQKPTKLKPLAWHYTTCVHLAAILQSGKLIPTGVGIESDERPALWFSMNQSWEPTANKAVHTPDGSVHQLKTMREVHEVMGVVRIGVDPAKLKLIGFDSFVRRSGISRTEASNLKAAGRKIGANPYDWPPLVRVDFSRAVGGNRNLDRRALGTAFAERCS